MSQSFTENFIRAFEAGTRARQARKREADDAEDRGIQKLLLQHQLQTMRVQDKVRARLAATQGHELRDGQPEAMFPIAEAGFKPAAQPSFFNGMRLPGQSFGLQATRRIEPTLIPGIEEYGVPELRLMPQTAEQKAAAARQAERDEVRIVPKGHAVFQGSERLAVNDEPDAAGAITYPRSNFGVSLQIAVQDAEAELGRKLRPDELRQLQTDTLRSLVSKPRASTTARASSRSGGDDPAFPRGVEAYVIALRNRGATQAEALEEVFRADVWKKLTEAHPNLRAERLREAVTRLVPEEGAPSSSDAGASGQPSPQTAQPGADSKVMTREELLAMAEAFNISEAEARRIYAARGYTIR